jgi:hypothetical protein
MNKFASICLFLSVILVTSWDNPYHKKQFTMAEATNGLTGPLAPKGIKGASWQPNG